MPAKIFCTTKIAKATKKNFVAFVPLWWDVCLPPRCVMNYVAAKFSSNCHINYSTLSPAHKKDRLFARETLSAFSIVICTFPNRNAARKPEASCFYCLKSPHPRGGTGMAFVLRRKVSSIKSLKSGRPALSNSVDKRKSGVRDFYDMEHAS
jgi:hypothetical protein